MIIKVEKADGNHKVLDFSSYLTCTSSSVKVTNQFFDFNRIAGLAHKEGSTLGSRTFAITGNFEAPSLKDVESFRSKVLSSLFNKNLLLFLDDDVASYYRCVLDGNVNTTYNIGWNVGRVFTLSFNLVAATPYLYGKERARSFYNGEYSFIIDYDGDVPTFPMIVIREERPLILKPNEEPFLICGDTSVNFIKEVEFIESNPNFVFIKQGLVTRQDGTTYPDVLDKESILNPLIMRKGKNEIKLNRFSLYNSKPETLFYNISNIYFVWQPIYY